jgi:hypothetical protein
VSPLSSLRGGRSREGRTGHPITEILPCQPRMGVGALDRRRTRRTPNPMCCAMTGVRRPTGDGWNRGARSPTSGSGPPCRAAASVCWATKPRGRADAVQSTLCIDPLLFLFTTVDRSRWTARPGGLALQSSSARSRCVGGPSSLLGTAVERGGIMTLTSSPCAAIVW